ncbi:hypothetical protein [Corynebacterium kozikiae]|uniref:hypothetical protein n=1 Tax=Corynebacterium kozikiae TaxID=2968469 RepID=UPI00211C47B5|nr:hypothetical protein [Corynebacterium sp. 76QC2CO]MCQ9342186.1 hypothetical protein [Corynebacterium sp. 76QC2CO]
MTTYTWRGQEMHGPSGVLAFVRAEILHVGDQRLLLETSQGTVIGFRARATSMTGEVFTIHKVSLTVHELAASCAGRSYRLVRTSPWRKVRDVLDADDQVVFRLRALTDGTLLAELPEAPNAPSIPTIDLVFLTYGAMLVDTPNRVLRI